LFGHLFFNVIGGYTEEKNPYYATVLRDPVERVLSLYHYVLKYPEHYRYDLRIPTVHSGT